MRACTTTGLFNVESGHRWKHSASTPQVAGHRIKSFEPKPLEAALMSPRRLSPPSNTFNYFEDTLETARSRINPAHYSSRKRQSRAGTTELISGGPNAKLHRWT